MPGASRASSETRAAGESPLFCLRGRASSVAGTSGAIRMSLRSSGLLAVFRSRGACDLAQSVIHRCVLYHRAMPSSRATVEVVGYRRLMGADEIGTLTSLKSHRRQLVDPGIAEHRGRIVKTTSDGMLVEFASVVDAVAFAVQGPARDAEAQRERPGRQ